MKSNLTTSFQFQPDKDNPGFFESFKALEGIN
jgi:hypothetical protein